MIKSYLQCICSFLVIVSVVGCFAASKEGKSKMEMSEKEFIDRLETVGITDRAAMELLLETVQQGSYSLPRKLINIWLNDKTSLAEKAYWIICSLDHLVLLPLLESVEISSAENKELLLTILSEEHERNRGYLFEKYKSFLDDTGEIPQSNNPMEVSEVPPFQKRVCDVAYLNIYRLYNMNMSTLDFISNSESYLHLPNKLRDEVVDHYQKTGNCRFEPLGGSEPTLSE